MSAVMANTMAMSARERLGEYATLKALGFGPGFLAKMIFGESLLLALVAVACGVGWRLAVVASLGLALSSTAIALQVMGERNLLPTGSGQAAFSILLFQDVAAIPILALLPLLGGVAEANEAVAGSSRWLEAAKIVAVIAGIVLGGRLLVRPLSDAFIAEYLDVEWPAIAGCVGCYRVEGPGVQLFSRMEGSHYTILGMPLLNILDYLRTRGVLTS